MQEKYQLIHGDCYDELKKMDDNSVDTVISDPPYGLGEIKDLAGLLQEWLDLGQHSADKVGAKGFMSKEWDSSVPPPAIWKEVCRVLKPGGTALVFAGTRTFDLMAISMQLAGFTFKDCIFFLHSEGFPKSLNISKKIDKTKGLEREVISETITKSGGMANVNKANVVQGHRPNNYNEHGNVIQITKPASPEAELWNGWHSHALKPAFEPILVMTKPNEGSYVDNALKWGVAGLNIEECRVPIGLSDREKYEQKRHSFKSVKTNKSANIDFNVSPILPPEQIIKNSENGRFPSNVIHDGSDDVMQEFNKYGKTKSGATKKDVNAYDGDSNTTLLRGKSNPQNQHGDSGSIARFYYCAKASKRDRTCDGQVENKHPAVKNRNLMSYLAKLTKTPTGGIVLDPFMGSGSTGIGCLMEGRYFIGIEKEKESFGTAKARLEIVANETCATANVHKKEKVPLSSNSQFPAIQMQEIDMFD